MEPCPWTLERKRRPRKEIQTVSQRWSSQGSRLKSRKSALTKSDSKPIDGSHVAEAKNAKNFKHDRQADQSNKLSRNVSEGASAGTTPNMESATGDIFPKHRLTEKSDRIRQHEGGRELEESTRYYDLTAEQKRKEAVRLLCDLLLKELSIGNELIEVFDRLSEGDTLSLNGIEDWHMRHLFSALNVKKLIVESTKEEDSTEKEYYADDSTRSMIKKSFEHLLRKALDKIHISWKEMLKSTNQVDDDSHSVSYLHEDNRRNSKQPISTLAQAQEPWGLSQANQQRKEKKFVNSNDEPWSRFDREKTFEFLNRKQISKKEFGSMMESAGSLRRRFAKEHREAEDRE